MGIADGVRDADLVLTRELCETVEKLSAETSARLRDAGRVVDQRRPGVKPPSAVRCPQLVSNVASAEIDEIAVDDLTDLARQPVKRGLMHGGRDFRLLRD